MPYFSLWASFKTPPPTEKCFRELAAALPLSRQFEGIWFETQPERTLVKGLWNNAEQIDIEYLHSSSLCEIRLWPKTSHHTLSEDAFILAQTLAPQCHWLFASAYNSKFSGIPDHGDILEAFLNSNTHLERQVFLQQLPYGSHYFWFFGTSRPIEWPHPQTQKIFQMPDAILYCWPKHNPFAEP